MSTRDTAVEFTASADTLSWGEQQLARQLRAGSVEAYNYLINIYSQPLFRFVSRLTRGSDDAADIVQEVFLKVFRSAAHFEGKSSVKTWIYQIALHEASNQRRWWKRHKSHETSLEDGEAGLAGWANRLPDGRESPLSQALRSEQRRHLQTALQQVPEPFHTALVLREVEGFSYDEIAEIVQVRVGTVKSRLMRGREIFRQAWMQSHAPATQPGGVSGLRSIENHG